MAARVAKKVPQNLVEELLNLKEEDLTLSYLSELFGEFNGKTRCNTYDEFTVPAGRYAPEGNTIKEPFVTTAGLWIFNKFFFEKDLTHVIRYINEPINKKVVGKINNKLSTAFMEDDITQAQLKRYLDKTQKMMPMVTILAPSQTDKLLLCTKAINKEKARLMKQYAKEIEAGDVYTIDKIEKELIEFAKDYLKDDPAADIYNSGARAGWNNEFKNMYISKGAIKDPDPAKGYSIVMDNYMDGISKENYTTMCRSLAAGPYARAVKTSAGGYQENIFRSAYQHIVLDKEGSDCGSDKYITVNLTKDNASLYMYMYMITGSTLTELTSKNVDKYIGKTVKFRFASFCKSKTGICHKCAGNIFYRLNVRNVGMATSIVASTLKNKQMKAFHDSVEKLNEMDPMKAFDLV